MTSILPRFHLFISLGAIVFLTFGGCSASIPAEDETELINEQTIPESASSESHTPASRSQKRHTNRLARETSPYLLLHAHNPVNWYPWGEEALSKANVEKKIIFLSVGYSSCFWCHVMERESFMDMEIADFLNEHFVCIKVDREERPDVDSIYMTAIQLLTRHGGWPMSVFLTPNARPFFGGTYFPARDDDRTGRPGFLTVIRKTQELWKDQRKMVEESAQRLSDAVKTELERRVNPQPIKLAPDILDNVRRQLADVYDPDYGGFGYSAQNPHRPKFPEPPKLLFQIERARRIGNDQTLQMLENTLDRMAEGGIRDHLGGGFHRYSTDRFWHIPHFEKMLYDNGQLATVYAEAYALTNRAVYRQVVDELLDFVTREMTSPDGGFYAALDAETDTEEGKYYRWEIEEIQEVLSDDQWQRMAPVYGFDSAPNFENEFYVPLLTERLREISPDILKQREVELNPLRAKLLEVRSRRERPLLDTKIITSWNGLMIRGFADAGRIFKNDAYIKTAARAADFVLAELQTENGRLLRNYAGGKANLNAYLDDYAYLIDGLIALHRATGKDNWLETADRLTSIQLALFWDKNHGGFFFTTDDHESLLARAKDPVDGVRPAGISVSADNLVYLARTLDRPEYLKRAEATIQSSADFLKQSPIAVTRMATAIMAWLDAGAEK